MTIKPTTRDLVADRRDQYAFHDDIVYLRETRSERLLCAATRAAHPYRPPAGELELLFSTGTEAGPSFNVWRLHDG